MASCGKGIRPSFQAKNINEFNLIRLADTFFTRVLGTTPNFPLII
jgi:hypothetical protein